MIPAHDVDELKGVLLGVAEVFTPGAPTDAIVEFIRKPQARRHASLAAPSSALVRDGGGSGRERNLRPMS